MGMPWTVHALPRAAAGQVTGRGLAICSTKLTIWPGHDSLQMFN
jgi:hypothetical protein